MDDPLRVPHVYFKFGDHTETDVGKDLARAQEKIVRDQYYTNNPDIGEFVFLWNELPAGVLPHSPATTNPIGIGKYIQRSITDRVVERFHSIVEPMSSYGPLRTSEWFCCTSVESVFLLRNRLMEISDNTGFIVVQTKAQLDGLIDEINWCLLPRDPYALGDD